MSAISDLKITLIRSVSGRLRSHQQSVRGLGLRKLHHSKVVKATPENLGMINQISYLLKIEEA
jgi:large subunit ribosomal protein L30